MVVSKVALSQALTDNQLVLSPVAIQQLIDYLTLLSEWNRVFNLTAITTPHEMIDLHLIDSLLIQPFLHGTRLLDVGTGAGLPGLPLAIAHTNQQWTLLDKNGKKTRFLKQVILELKLSNVEIVQERSEHFHPAQGFDTIVSRALGSLALFTTTTAHLLNPEGYWLALKGKYPQEELEAVDTSVQIIDIKPIVIQGRDVARHIVLMKKGTLRG